MQQMMQIIRFMGASIGGFRQPAKPFFARARLWARIGAMNPPSRPAWLMTLALAEALAIAVVATTYAAIDRGLIGAAALAILAAGAFEGLCLGSAQAAGLARVGAKPLPWIILTMLGAAVGYGLSILGQPDADAGQNAPDAPLWLMAAGGAGMGLAMGAILGALQSPALPANIAKTRWIARNAIGWIPAMMAIMIAAGLAQPAWPLAMVAALGALSGAIAGFCVAFATYPLLRKAHTGPADPSA